MNKPHQARPKNQRTQEFHPYPFWAPRFWNGMRMRPWLRLLSRHRYDVHPLRWPMALTVTACAAFNSALARLQAVIYGRQITATQINESPIFILGHWRSGTTLLHELLACDDRLAFPTTFQCFLPHHFLLTEKLLSRLVRIPARRPMDNVKLDWKNPQEDEFALCVLGAASPYLRLAFPNHPPEFLEYLDMTDVDPGELSRWKTTLVDFMRHVSFRNEKPLVLKSPGHTGRVRVLLELFPKARFVHMVRSPFALIPSTVRLWQSLESVQGLHFPRHTRLEEFVFDSFERLYAGFERDACLIDPNHICTVRYEDLIANPIGQVERLYQELDLDDFQYVQSAIDRNLQNRKGYTANRHHMPERLHQKIASRCADYIDTYGYATECGLDASHDKVKVKPA